jgi:damage-control phosphatase, subfamily I
MLLGRLNKMKTYFDCIPCFLRQTVEAARNVTDDETVIEKVLRDVLRATADADFDRPPPYVGQLIHRRIKALTGIRDPYLAAKKRLNRLTLDALSELGDIVNRAADPLLAAARLSIAANAIDMGISTSFSSTDIQTALQEFSKAPFTGDVPKFKKAVEQADEILFLADNAGEIAVDKLLIETLGPRRVTLAVRGGPVLNDAVREDAQDVKIPHTVELIDNGSDAPGTILSDCSDTFLKKFHCADLIIAKGQGNFESLSEVQKNIFFLFKVKCPVISRRSALPLGTHALLHQSEIPA